MTATRSEFHSTPRLDRVKQFLAISLALACAVSVAAAKDEKAKTTTVHGYVTEILTPTEFKIEDFKIKGVGSITLEVERAEPDFYDDTDDEKSPSKQDSEPEIRFSHEEIQVGTELEVTGTLDPVTNTLDATSVKVIYDDPRNVKGEAVLEDQPKLTKKGKVWNGELLIDGRRLLVDEVTKIKIFPGKESPEKDKKKAARKKESGSAADEPQQVKAEDLARPDQVKQGMIVRYWARRFEDGTLVAKRLEFKHLAQGLSVLGVLSFLDGSKKVYKFKEPNYEKGKYGFLKIDKKHHYKAPPVGKQLREYLQDLGNRLVPFYMRNMEDDDEEKITFQFVPIETKKPNAFSMPNGHIGISVEMLDAMETEGQLAFVMSHEIAHVVQRHSIRDERANAKKRTIAKGVKLAGSFVPGFGGLGMRIAGRAAEAAIVAGYRRSLENQADRMALRYMTEAGYDPREGPRVWKVMTRKFNNGGRKFLWSNHDKNTTRRSYLMTELRQNYQALDYSAYGRSGANQRKFAAALSEAGDFTKEGKKRKKKEKKKKKKDQS